MVLVVTKTKAMNKKCSGSIIGEFHVLTAAHCLCPGHMISITVVTGTINANSDSGHKYSVQLYSIHPERKPYCWGIVRTFLFDIAILKTVKRIQFSDKAQPIDLYFDEIPDNLISVIMGYGSIERRYVGVLRYIFTTARKCFNEICTPTQEIGSRDSGGPLAVCHDGLKECRQFGVASSFNANGDFFCFNACRARLC